MEELTESIGTHTVSLHTVQSCDYPKIMKNKAVWRDIMEPVNYLSGSFLGIPGIGWPPVVLCLRA